MKRSTSRLSLITPGSPLRIGFLPVNDCAPLVAAQELGFFSKYALKVELKRQKSWTDIRDGFVERRLDAAQGPVTLPLLMSVGVNSELCSCVSGLVMSLSGSGITVSRALWQAGLRRQLELSRMKVHRTARLSFGIPCHGSTQEFLIRRWMQSVGLVPETDARILVVPPEQMFPMMKLGYIDGYCVGEPWTSMAVQAAVGVCVATSSQLTPMHPETVLMTRETFNRERADEHRRLMAALIEAGEFCDRPWNRKSVAGMLADKRYVGAPRECIAPGIVGPFSTWDRLNTHPAGLNIFHRFQTNQPGPSKVDWIVHQLTLNPPAGHRLVKKPLGVLAREVYLPRLFADACRLVEAHARMPLRRGPARKGADQKSLAA